MITPIHKIAAEADELPMHSMPTLPSSLLDLIGNYGMARSECTVGGPEFIERYQALIKGIKDYAAEQQHAALESLRADNAALQDQIKYYMREQEAAAREIESLRAGRAVPERAEAALSMLEDPSKEMLEAFQRGFMAQLKRRKHYKKGWEISAEQAGIKAMLEEVLAKVDAAAPTPPQAEQAGKGEAAWTVHQYTTPVGAKAWLLKNEEGEIRLDTLSGVVRVSMWDERNKCIESSSVTQECAARVIDASLAHPAPQPDDARDARRYRWLRSDDIEVPDGQREISVVLHRLPFSDDPDITLIESELDAAIDAAIAATADHGGEA